MEQGRKRDQNLAKRRRSGDACCSSWTQATAVWQFDNSPNTDACWLSVPSHRCYDRRSIAGAHRWAATGSLVVFKASTHVNQCSAEPQHASVALGSGPPHILLPDVITLVLPATACEQTRELSRQAKHSTTPMHGLPASLAVHGHSIPMCQTRDAKLDSSKTSNSSKLQHPQGSHSKHGSPGVPLCASWPVLASFPVRL